jgi:RNA polymerase sigma-70 factor (ECF subfamily)
VSRFPTTRWTLLLSARQDPASRRDALEQLCATYWRPVYFYVRRRGLDRAAAEDAVQDVFMRLLESDALARLDPARGRFRGYLRTVVDHSLATRHERAQALKRGGGLTFVALDLEGADADLQHVPEDPERAFDREWALGVMDRALRRLRADYEDGRRKGDADTVLRFFSLEEAPSYAEAAAACGMTPAQFKAAVHRARVRYRELVAEEVQATLAQPAEEGAELDELRRALAP